MIQRQSGELHFRQVTTLLRRRWGLIAVVALTGAAAAAALGVLMPPRYTAKAQLIYDTQVVDGVEVVDDAAVETLVELLVSPSHLRSVAASLAQDPGPAAAPAAVPAPVAGAAAPPAAPSADAGRAPSAAAGAAAPAPAGPRIPDYEELDRRLSSFKERRSRLIAVTFVSTDPTMAATVANRAVDLYLGGVAARQRAERDATLSGLAQRIVAARVDLDRAEDALRAHRVANGLVEGGQADQLDLQIAELGRQAAITASELAALRARQSALGAPGGLAPPSGRRDGPQIIGAPDRAPDEVQVAASDAPAVFDDADRGDPGAPVRDMAPAADDSVRLALDAQVLEARLRDIDGRLDTLRRASGEAADTQRRVRDLARAAAEAGQIHDSLVRRQAELMARSAPRPPARVVSVAEPPARPSSPDPVLFIFPAIIAAGLVGGMLAILLERLDQRLRSERDVEEALGAPCIGLVPKVARAQLPALPRLLRNDPFAPYTEAIRAVVVGATRRVSRAGAGHGDGFQSFLITSAGDGEGKTTLAISFAVYAARLRRRVLLIDLNFRNPGIAVALGEDGRPGGGDPAGNIFVAPDPDPGPGIGVRAAAGFGIDYLALSDPKVDPLVVLGGGEFPKLLAQLAESYDCVVIDSAPALGATETRLLASMVDRVIFAVQWGATEARAARMAMQQLRAGGAAGCAPVSVVVTQVNMRAHERHRYGEAGPAMPAAPLVQGA